MTVAGLVAVALRVFALWIAVLSVQSISMALATNVPGWVVPVIVGLALVLMAFVWLFAWPIAKRCVPPQVRETSVALDALGLLRVGTCIIGIVAVKEALPQLISGFAYMHLQAYPSNPELAFRAKLAITTSLALLAFGIALFFGNMRVASVLTGRRELGSDG